VSNTPFQLSIVTPAKTVYEGAVTSVTLPASDGYLGVWANHAPMVAAMRPGVLAFNDVEDPNRGLVYAVGGGFCEVSNNHLIILVDSADAAGEIDFDAVRSELRRKREELRARMNEPDFDAEAARNEIEVFEAQVKVGYTRGS
jgi:F-type H+-transporting ATPase subunit epsilon